MPITDEELEREAEIIRVASRKAIDAAIRLHRGLELPMAVWKNGEPAWVTADEAESLLLQPLRADPDDSALRFAKPSRRG